MENFKKLDKLMEELLTLGKAIIAGGSVSDFVTGNKKPKDYDILFQSKSSSSFYDEIDLEKILLRCGFEVSKSGYKSCSVVKGHTSRNLGNHQIEFVLKFVGHGIEGDLICLNVDPVERVRWFPSNRCMCWFEGYELKSLPEFSLFLNGELHFYPTCSEEYRERVKGYYPNFKVTVDLGE